MQLTVWRTYTNKLDTVMGREEYLDWCVRYMEENKDNRYRYEIKERTTKAGKKEIAIFKYKTTQKRPVEGVQSVHKNEG